MEMQASNHSALPPSAQAAWQAYLDMEASKREHFELLAQLDERERSGGPTRTLAEQNRLEWLLNRHDEQVRSFRTAIRQLAVDDAGGHQALLDHLTAHNARLGSSGTLN